MMRRMRPARVFGIAAISFVCVSNLLGLASSTARDATSPETHGLPPTLPAPVALPLRAQKTAFIVVSATSGFVEAGVTGPIKSKLRAWARGFGTLPGWGALKVIQIRNDGSVMTLAEAGEGSAPLSEKELLAMTDALQFVGEDNAPLRDVFKVMGAYSDLPAPPGPILYIAEGRRVFWRPLLVPSAEIAHRWNVTVVSLGNCEEWLRYALGPEQSCHDLETPKGDPDVSNALLEDAFISFGRDVLRH